MPLSQKEIRDRAVEFVHDGLGTSREKSAATRATKRRRNGKTSEDYRSCQPRLAINSIDGQAKPTGQ